MDNTSSAICFDLHNATALTAETGHILTPHMPTRKASGEIRAIVDDVFLGLDKYAMSTILGFLDASGEKFPSPTLRPNRFVIVGTTYLAADTFYLNWQRLFVPAELLKIQLSGYKFLVVCEPAELTSAHAEIYTALKSKLGEQLDLITGKQDACVDKILEMYGRDGARGK